MIIGSHTMTHPILANLSVTEQRAEIKGSFDALSRLLSSPIITFSYPYGRVGTFDQTTIALLQSIFCQFSFNVNHKDITESDINENIQELPRWDCNQLSYGTVRNITQQNLA